MAEYIEREAVINVVANNPYNVAFKTSKTIQEIENLPSADVVEVVRCKDCRFKTLTEDGEYNPHDIVCEIHMSDGFNETDYCSYGERKCDNG